MSFRRVLRAFRREQGYTLVEMLTTLTIMGVVMGALGTLFVSANNSEADMNNRFRAQQTARLGLDKMRREVHCASTATPGTANGPSSSVTLTLASFCKTLPQPLPTPLPSYCSASGGQTTCSVTWCTRNVTTNRNALYRVTGSTCGASGGEKWADYLIPTATAPGSPTCSDGPLCVFTYVAPTTSLLAKLNIDLPVNVRPRKTTELFELQDALVLRNSARSS
jgi:prepilin-type N-terminal cleavage/methylation domain-containing protein